MIAFFLAFVITASSCTTGTMSQYSRGATERVIANRSIDGRTAYTLPADWRERYDGLLAVSSCRDLGREYDVWWGGHYGRMLAFDCAGDAATRAWMRRGRIVGELDYYTSRRWGARIGRGLRGAVMCQRTHDYGTIDIGRK